MPSGKLKKFVSEKVPGCGIRGGKLKSVGLSMKLWGQLETSDPCHHLPSPARVSDSSHQMREVTTFLHTRCSISAFCGGGEFIKPTNRGPMELSFGKHHSLHVILFHTDNAGDWDGSGPTVAFHPHHVTPGPNFGCDPHWLSQKNLRTSTTLVNGIHGDTTMSGWQMLT